MPVGETRDSLFSFAVVFQQAVFMAVCTFRGIFMQSMPFTKQDNIYFTNRYCVFQNDKPVRWDNTEMVMQSRCCRIRHIDTTLELNVLDFMIDFCSFRTSFGLFMLYLKKTIIV